jgi:hypothetical protein
VIDLKFVSLKPKEIQKTYQNAKVSISTELLAVSFILNGLLRLGPAEFQILKQL